MMRSPTRERIPLPKRILIAMEKSKRRRTWCRLSAQLLSLMCKIARRREASPLVPRARTVIVGQRTAVLMRDRLVEQTAPSAGTAAQAGSAKTKTAERGHAAPGTAEAVTGATVAIAAVVVEIEATGDPTGAGQIARSVTAVVTGPQEIGTETTRAAGTNAPDTAAALHRGVTTIDAGGVIGLPTGAETAAAIETVAAMIE
ncbi:MAG: hypothetical protein WBJ81_02745, partial [Rickettsiales bacterium]